MSGDEVFNDLWKSVLFCQFDTIGNMTDDDLCTLLIAETLVWIYICLVLCEECRILHLADIVIQSPSTYELTIGSNAISCFSCKIGHLQGVLESARCNF